MEIFPLKNKVLESQEDLTEYIIQGLYRENCVLQEGDILVCASKICGICEGRITESADIAREADTIIEDSAFALTITNGIFVANAGIDQSNVPGEKVVCWPKEPYKTAAHLKQALCTHFSITKLGIIITDSVCTPLRVGTTGIALGYAGFQGIEDKRGANDLFGRTLEVSRLNIADSLAVTANLVMGESDEATPMAIIRNAPKVVFTEEPIDPKSLSIPPHECLFKALYPESLLEPPL